MRVNQKKMKAYPDRSLLRKYLQNECTEEERIHIEQWYLALGKQLPDPDPALDYAGLEQEIWTRIQGSRQNKPQKFPWTWAAAAILLIGFGFLFFNQTTEKVQPGTNKATLLTRSGKHIAVNDKGKTALLNLSDAAQEPVSALVTPRGGAYTVKLPDGSLVRLNADSRLDVADDFMQGSTRVVQLKGEAYFEVKSMPDKPFRVQLGNAYIEVLGTHFNVESYPGDSSIKATLIEGRILIAKDTQQRILTPGEQARIEAGGQDIIVNKQVNTQDVLAWTRGYFAFDNDRIDQLLGEIARWYQIEINYPEGVPDKHLTGRISKSSQIDEVLQMLKYAGITYTMEGRTLTILNPMPM